MTTDRKGSTPNKLPPLPEPSDDDLPVPAFRLIWRNGAYYVSEPSIGNTDCYTAEQVHAARAQAFHDGQCAALQADAREKGEIADLESDIDTLVDHNMALQSAIRDAIKIHSSFGTTADMADWLRDELDALATQPVTPAGGEVEKLIDLLEDVAVQHEGLESYGDSCGPRMCIRACRGAIEALRAPHPPVADAALVRDAERYRFLRNDAYECVVPHGAKVRGHRTGWITHIQPGADFDSAIDSAMQDAALNQRGGLDGTEN